MFSKNFNDINFDDYIVKTNEYNGRVYACVLKNQKNKTGNEYELSYHSGKYTYTSVKQYLNGKLHGKSSFYRYTGDLIEEITYDHGLMTLKETFKHGLITSTSKYNSGKKHGECLSYVIADDVQILVTRENYENGSLHGAQHYYSEQSGLLIEEANYVSGKMHGVQTKYYSISTDGKTFRIKSTTEYENGKIHGQHTEYYLNGSVKSIVNYRKGCQCGYQATYDRSSKAVKEKFVLSRKNLLSVISELVPDYKKPVDDTTYTFLKLKYK